MGWDLAEWIDQFHLDHLRKEIDKTRDKNHETNETLKDNTRFNKVGLDKVLRLKERITNIRKAFEMI